MARKLFYFLLPAIVLAVSIGLGGSRPYAPATNAVSLVSPSACPSPGCAAGQRLNMRAEFNLGAYINDGTTIPNVQVCIYFPNSWSATGFKTGLKGGVSDVGYTTSTSYCGVTTTPANYSLLTGASANLPPSMFGDSLTFAFRLGSTATTTPSGSVLVSVWVRNSSNVWESTSQAFSTIPVTAAGLNVYVANDSAACGGNFPCYVNSGDDDSGGVGTGLKDAIDSSTNPITINVLGNYIIKNNSVLLDEPHLLTGINNASLGYQGTDCSQPMLNITGGATVRGLAISGMSCASGNRNLIRIESANAVAIESNDLTNGQDAIQVGSANSAPIEVRYNNIQFNAGYGIYLFAPGTSPSSPLLDGVANNIFGNRSGAQVECNGAGNGVVDHNFWGALSTSAAISQCTFTDAKRLGAAIEDNTNGPGVSSQLVSATSTLSNAFNNQIGFQLSGADTALNLYIVNHGANIPFTAAQPGNLTPCSNYWDVFLADSTTPDSSDVLTLHFKYSLSATCTSTINSTRYCNQTADQSQYPLFWYEVNANTWERTGQNLGGQPTTCDLTQNEIQVAIDGSAGRPDFNDLARVPFVVGLPGQPSAVVLSSFTAQPGSMQVYLNWSTSSEINTNGFIVMRSTQQDTGFVEVSSLIPAQGTSISGASYQFTDNDPLLINGTTYYYRLKVLNFDGTTVLTGTISVTPIPATSTATPTRTNTPTITRTVPSRTPTRTRTYYPTSTKIIKSPTPTRTFTPTPTSPFQTITNTSSPVPTTTPGPSTGTGTVTPESGTLNATPSPGAATQLANMRATRTALAALSATVTVTVIPADGPGTPLSLTAVLAILALFAAIAGAVIYFFRGHLKLPA